MVPWVPRSLFLILHDLYESDTQVKELYQNLQNTETTSIPGFLHYYPCPPQPDNARYTCPEGRDPTAEDELLKKYDQHFGLKGLAALHARNIQWARSLDKSGVFGLSHTERMAPKVCNILTPKITLVLDPASIDENGGESTLKAMLSRQVNEETVVTISAVAVHPAVAGDFTLSGTTLTIPANMTESTETITITATDNDAHTANKSVTVSAATVTSTQSPEGPPDVTLEIVDDETPPMVTLVLDPASIDENGGESTMKATLNRPSSEETAIVVLAMEGNPPVPADSIIPNEYTLTIPPNKTESTETVTITGVNDDASRVNRVVTMSATATNSQGVITPLVDVMLEIIDSYVVPPPPPPLPPPPPPPSPEDNEMPENIEETEASPQSSADNKGSLKTPTSSGGCTIASSEDKDESTIREIVFNFSLTVAGLLLVLIPTASISPMRNRG